MSDARQLPLPLPHRPALGREDFLVAPCNADAVAWLDRWPDWPSGGLVVHGPPGCGKTHLGEVWRARAGPQGLLVDEADGAADERALLHRINFARESGRTALLLARAPPSRWALALPDLRSRLLALPAVAVGPPDDALLAAVLVKLLADRQAAVVGDDVIGYLVARMERSFAAAGRLAAALDRASLAGKRPVTTALARRVLEGLSDEEP